jgi:hypothetical protein
MRNIVKQRELLELLLEVLVSDHVECPDDEQMFPICILMLYTVV